VNHGGQVLDPGGISFAVQGGWDRGPEITWDGFYWVAGYNGGITSPEIQRLGYRVLESPIPELVSVTLTPFDPPIEIPAPGGSFTFNIAVTNNDSTPQNFDVWCEVTLPNGNPYGPV
jgi:hypothetical protein